MIFFLLYLLKKKPKPNDNHHSKQNILSNQSSKTVQASDCLCKEQCIFLLCKLIKKCTQEACFWIATNMQGDFVISQYPLGHPNPLLHQNTDNELQLQQ